MKELRTVFSTMSMTSETLTEARIEEMTKSLTTLTDKSVTETDMQIHMNKTYSQHVCRKKTYCRKLVKKKY